MSSLPSSTVSSIYQPQNVTIVAGQTVSDAAKVFGATAVGVIIPDGVGASITYQVSADDINFYPLTDGDTGDPLETLLSGTEAQAVTLIPAKFFGWTSIKIVIAAPGEDDKIFTVVPKAI